MTNPKTVTEFLDKTEQLLKDGLTAGYDYDARIEILLELARHSPELNRELRNVDHYPLRNCLSEDDTWGTYFPIKDKCPACEESFSYQKIISKIEGEK